MRDLWEWIDARGPFGPSSPNFRHAQGRIDVWGSFRSVPHQLKHHLHRLTCLPTPLYTESSTGRTMLWALEARNLGYVRGDQILHGIPGLARSSIAHRTGHPRAPRWLLRKLWNRLLPLEPYPGFVKSAVSQIQDCCTYSRLSDNVQHEMC